jgi:hypothetical protein
MLLLHLGEGGRGTCKSSVELCSVLDWLLRLKRAVYS